MRRVLWQLKINTSNWNSNDNSRQERIDRHFQLEELCVDVIREQSNLKDCIRQGTQQLLEQVFDHCKSFLVTDFLVWTVDMCPKLTDGDNIEDEIEEAVQNRLHDEINTSSFGEGAFGAVFKEPIQTFSEIFEKLSVNVQNIECSLIALQASNTKRGQRMGEMPLMNGDQEENVSLTKNQKLAIGFAVAAAVPIALVAADVSLVVAPVAAAAYLVKKRLTRRRNLPSTGTTQCQFWKQQLKNW